MALGYHKDLFILAADHRGSFQKKTLGIEGTPTEEDNERTRDAKQLIAEGMTFAAQAHGDASVLGMLVDEEFGGNAPKQIKESGLQLAMPVERSGQEEFELEYGDDFDAHIEEFDPDFSKVLVRYNPDGDREMNERQLGRLRQLSEWLFARDRKFLFELLVPAEPAQLDSVGGDTERYDAELRPELMRRAIEDIQNAGIETGVWKIEGVETSDDCRMLVAQARTGQGREGVTCVLLGRGASQDKVEHWLRVAAPVEGFIGFAIGRSIWNEPLKAWIDGALDREKAAQQIADNYLGFVRTYLSAR